MFYKVSLVFACILLNQISHAGLRPNKESVALIKAFLPIGYDSNDQIEFVVGGVLPNTCYQVGDTFAKIDGKQIVVDQRALKYGGPCYEVTVPFKSEIKLKKMLDEGTYDIVDKASQKTLGQLVVKRATDAGSGPDEFWYAPLDDAYVVKNSSTKKQELVLLGTFTNNCLFLKKVEMIPYADHVIVLPIVDKHDRENCETGSYPFNEALPLKKPKAPAYLLHVRSMNGKAINKLVSGLTN